VFFGHCFVAPFVRIYWVEKVSIFETFILPLIVGFRGVLFEINYYPI